MKDSFSWKDKKTIKLFIFNCQFTKKKAGLRWQQRTFILFFSIIMHTWIFIDLMWLDNILFSNHYFLWLLSFMILSNIQILTVSTRLSPSPFDIPPKGESFLDFWHEVCQAYFVLFCLRPEICWFSKNLWEIRKNI